MVPHEGSSRGFFTKVPHGFSTKVPHGFFTRVPHGLIVAVALVATVSAQQNRIDTVTPSAPELAAYGAQAIGVRTIQVTDRNRPDILNTKEGGLVARYDRTLTLEVWYPASDARAGGGEYRGVITREPSIVVTLNGRAVRDAAPAAGPFPLVIISHGYPGNRYLMSHLGENLASKGFVTVSIDHKDSTYDDQKAFGSTLYNRSFDQLFVLNEMARLGSVGAVGRNFSSASSAESTGFLAGLVDATRAGIVGYSMGGYGVVNVIGGGYSKASETINGAPPNRLLADRGASNPAYQATIDPRIKAAVAIGPWGMQGGFWDAEGLKGIRTPVLFVTGSMDDVSGYERGTRAIYQGAVNADRYLLTFVNANHNAAAPYPAPVETLQSTGFSHYADAVWDTARMNNILAHFATAFFGWHVKGDAAKKTYFDVVPNGRDAVHAMDRDGKPQSSHTYWKGFKRGTAVGLVLEHASPTP